MAGFTAGKNSPPPAKPRGGDTAGLKPPQFVFCISNHDQVGNRAFGERLGHVISPAAYRAVSALLCLVPQTPLLFMGQEWSASTPFQFFTDHNPELGQLVTAGRRQEFRKFAAFRDPKTRENNSRPAGREHVRAREALVGGIIRLPPRGRAPALPGIPRRAQEPSSLARSFPGSLARARDRGGRDCIPHRRRDSASGSRVVRSARRSGGCSASTRSGCAPQTGVTGASILSSNETRFGGEATSAGPVTLVLEAV